MDDSPLRYLQLPRCTNSERTLLNTLQTAGGKPISQTDWITFVLRRDGTRVSRVACAEWEETLAQMFRYEHVRPELRDEC